MTVPRTESAAKTKLGSVTVKELADYLRARLIRVHNSLITAETESLKVEYQAEVKALQDAISNIVIWTLCMDKEEGEND